MTNLKLEIECGKTTCASEPGKFCKYVWGYGFGQKFFCKLFHNTNWDRKGRPSQLEDKDGWLQRCEECLASEVPTTKGNNK